MNESSIVLFKSKDGAVHVNVQMKDETVWLSQTAMAKLFDKDRSVITKHIRNIFKDGELDENSVCANFAHTAADGKTYTVLFYNLDVIISVGYRVKSQRGVEFRRWATGILKDYVLRGYAVNRQRLAQLGQMVQILKRAQKRLGAGEVLSVVEQYAEALDLLDGYDHQTIGKPKGSTGNYVLTYAECRAFIDSMKFVGTSSLFGNEKDDSFKGSIGAIYQTFDGKELYPTREEKAANLLYFIVKNHSFLDGNKRIGAAMFLYFLEKNKILRNKAGNKRIADATLVALTVMIAESRPAERELMVNLVMTFLVNGK